jgi:predicted transcriptional regulator of viral defense system
MQIAEKIEQLIKLNKGIITAKDFKSKNIPRCYFDLLIKKGTIKKIARGIYASIDISVDDMFILQSTYPLAIYSHSTALFIHNLSDRVPIKPCVTLPSKYNPGKNNKLLNPKLVDIKRCDIKFHKIGITTNHSYKDFVIKLYNKERTICDILRDQKNIDPEVIIEGIKLYMKSKDKNLPLLTKYAKQFRILKRLRPYMEALL